jgi:hypothetical protein
MEILLGCYGMVWARHAIKTRSGAVNLVFERSPPPIQADLKSKTEVPFNSEMEKYEAWFFSRSVQSICHAERIDNLVSVNCS